MMRAGRPSVHCTLRVLPLLVALASAVAVADTDLATAPAAQPAGLNLPPLTGVTVYDPTKAMSGLTLDLAQSRKPTLFDMNGRVVRTWHNVRIRDRMRLLDNCNLLAIGRGRRLVEYDWNGNVVWEHRLNGILIHHDVIRMESGNTMFIIQRSDGQTDDIVEVDREGSEIWRWRSGEHMGEAVKRLVRRGEMEITHLNSIRELVDNRLARAGDARFRTGNILVSSRDLNMIFVIDKETKEIVWRFTERLDGQHEAVMIPDGFVNAGNIILFNNRTRRQGSAILEVDPSTDEVVWRYESMGFFSTAKSVEQPLPNGNILVTSSNAGRIFEITRDGEIVWEFVRPYSLRAERYAYDHCPELAKLGPPNEIAVRAPAEHRHIDRALYRWRDRKTKLEMIALRNLKILKKNDSCDSILVPASAELLLNFGLRPIAIEQAGLADYAVRFRLSISPEGSADRSDLVDVTLRPDEELSNQTRVDLRSYTHQWVSLCTDAEAIGEGVPEKTRKFAFWEHLRVIIRGGDEAESQPEDTPLEDLEGFTDEELEVRKQHLKALGYVD